MSAFLLQIYSMKRNIKLTDIIFTPNNPLPWCTPDAHWIKLFNFSNGSVCVHKGKLQAGNKL